MQTDVGLVDWLLGEEMVAERTTSESDDRDDSSSRIKGRRGDGEKRKAA
jgi:hypothetical protein